MIKDMVVNLPINVKRDVVTPYATSVAGTFGAQLTGIAFRYQPVMAPYILGNAEATFIEKMEAEAKEAAQKAVDQLELEIRREQLPWTTRQIEASPEGAAGKFAEIARAFDIAIVGQADPDGPVVDDLMVEAALFESGRPVLVVPYIQQKPFRADRIAMCWDGSRSAARAIADAMPLLNRNSEILLLSVVGERVLREELAGADMADHLACHGYKVETHTLPQGGDIASTILNFVSDHNIDLLVMGGYGHSRLREFVLGGATRGILQSMTVPTLMAH